MMKAILFWLLTIFSLTTAPYVHAQQTGKTPRIGLLVPGSASSFAIRIDAFRKGLRDLGYIEGKNIIIEYRYSDGKLDPLPNLAVDLVRLSVDAIVTSSGSAIRATMNASKSIPVVFTAVAVDPVEDGLVSSLARPGANVTGLTVFGQELDGKRIEILKETLPKVTRVAFLTRGARAQENPRFREVETVAETLGLRLQFLGVKGADDFESAFKAAKNGSAQALTTTSSPMFTTHRARIVTLARNNRLPGMYVQSDFVEVGGLMSYGPDLVDNWRRAATYVDKILKGAKPADLPVEQPTKFEFIINLKAAKAIGLTIPPNVLVRADRVIR
jgi:putative ABC transport system substrate-binding protein